MDITKTTSELDKIAEEIQPQNPLIALAIDKISDNITTAGGLSDARDMVVYKEDDMDKIKDLSKKMNTFRAFLDVKDSNYIDINAHTMTHAETIVKRLGIKGMSSQSKKYDFRKIISRE